MDTAETRPLNIIAPPPALYSGAFALGGAIQAVAPLEIFSASRAHWLLGGVLLLLSGAFARWAFLTLRAFGTTANPKKPTEAVATGGPFRFSRNPIYLAMTGLYAGLALLLNAAWPLLLLVPLLFLMEWGVIRREERYLAGKFGDAYTAYRATVRRWL